MSIQNLVFDCGEVLLHFDLLEISRCFVETEEDAAILEKAFSLDWRRIDEGTMEYSDFCQAVLARLPDRLAENAARMQREWFLKEPAIPGMPEFLMEMQRTYDCYILSNAPAFFGQHLLEAVPASAHVKGKLISGDVRLMKPDERIYQLFLQRFHLKGETCLFIDDRPENVAGAEAVGMHGVTFDGKPETVRRRLKELAQN